MKLFHKLSIGTLKTFFRLIRRARDIFSGIGVAFITAIFVLGFSVLTIWGFYFLRQFIENRIASKITFNINLTKESEPPAQSAGSPPPGKSAAIESPDLTNIPQPSDGLPAQAGLIYAGYTDLFSGVGGLNRSETTMYRDNEATAFMFQPSLKWDEKNESSAATDFSSACIGGSTGLTTGGSCISAKGTVLTLNGSPLKLPVAGDIENVTADALGNGWAVGIVLKENGGYAGYAYRFDGSSFTPVFSGGKAFNSQYKGAWGFGGTADDFLAVYGAYQGKGYRVRGNNVADISQFFDVRIMRGGIRPGIVKAGEGVHAAWYLFNKEKNNRAVFVKLFQNGTADIVGEADLLGTAPFSFSYLAITGVSGSFPFSLSVYGEGAGSFRVWDVTDNGFKIPSAQVAAVSVNLNNYSNTEIPYLIGLAPGEFSAGGADISFGVRNTDGGEWETVTPGADYWFKNPHGAALEWRMTVKPGNNPEYTPHLGNLLVEYRVKRL